MDYEKAYKEALERARGIHKFSSDIAEIKRMEQIFPELAESEDEKIRTGIIDFVKSCILITDERYHKFLVWLEKRKPIKWSEEDEYNLNMAIYFMRSENTSYSPADVEPVVEWLCGLKQRMEEQQ